jgi:hypothetical protein
MGSGHGIMAVVTTRRSHSPPLHLSILPDTFAPQTDIIGDVCEAQYRASRHTLPLGSTASLDVHFSCIRLPNANTSYNSYSRVFLHYSAPLSPYTSASGARRRVSPGCCGQVPQPAFPYILQQRSTCIIPQ